MNATNPYFAHKYNPDGPAGFFLTFHTYGTWLHGDPRGSVNSRGDNIPGTPIVFPNADLVKLERSKLKQPEVVFNTSQRESIDSTIRQVCAYKNWHLHSLSVRTEHVHAVISGLIEPESMMNGLKSWCTRKMWEEALWSSSFSPWSRHGSTRYLWNEKDIQDACNYVINYQD